MKKMITIIIFLIFSNFIFSEEYLSGKILSLVSSSEIEEDENIAEILKYKIEVLEGKKKGTIIEIDFPIYKEKQYNIYPKVKDKVVLYQTIDEYNDKEEYKIYISDIDRRNSLYTIIIIFIVGTLIIARRKGFNSIVALILTILFIVKIFIPAISKGYSPILFSILVCIFSTIASIYLILGFNKKFVISALGTIGGVLIAGIVSYFFTDIMRLTGYADEELLGSAMILKNINLKEIISSGVIIGSLGAVMDVSVSISSSINEIYEANKEISSKSLFSSAMKIGVDVIGTMVNTLILAYMGSSIITILLIYMQSHDYPLIRVINSEIIVIEILRSICGSLGILFAIPLTALIGVKIYKRH